MDGPSAVYYDYSGHHIDAGQNQAAPRQCSVRGCSQLITDGSTKMCDTCRGRHRIYATTKRARRKLEKAAVSNSTLAGGNALTLIHENNSAVVVEKDYAVPNMWLGNGQLIMEQGSSMAHSHVLPHEGGGSVSYMESAWGQGVEPMLESVQTIVQPHQRSLQSEMAHVLTFRAPGLPLQAEDLVQSQAASSSPGILVDAAGMSSGQLNASSIQLPPEQSSTEDVLGHDDTKGEGGSETMRYCSVKGCKTLIAASYTFKMCPECRVRYRTYGTTKRAKWKYERESFQKEIEKLRVIEDEKRKAKGLRPLSDNPEELRAWELSVIDEQVPLPSVGNQGSLSSMAGAINVGMSSTQPPEGSTSFSPNPAGDAYTASASPVETHSSVSPYAHLNMPYSGSPVPPLPARMCTVSHCHKILPGFYRYKRCEQHRLQNRYHSQLKRVREKEVKAAGSDQSLQFVDVSSAMTEASSAMDGSGVDQCVVKAMRDRRLKMLRKRRKPQPKKPKSSAFVDGQEAPAEQADSGRAVAHDGSTGEASIWHYHVERGHNSSEAQFTDSIAQQGQPSASTSVPQESASSAPGPKHGQAVFMLTDEKHHANPSTAQKRQYEKHSKFSCASIDCHNLLTPGIRWRKCEDCRAIERQRRTNERRAAQGLDTAFSTAAHVDAQGHSAHDAYGQAVDATGAQGLHENNRHGQAEADPDDSQSDADADGEGDEDGEGEPDPSEADEGAQAPPAADQPPPPTHGRQLIWKTNSPEDSAPWASGFSKFRVEKPRPPHVATQKESHPVDSQSSSDGRQQTVLTANDGVSFAQHSPVPAHSVANAADGGGSEQTNPSAGQQAHGSPSRDHVPLATATLPTSNPPTAVEPSAQTVVSPSGPPSVSSKARGKRKAVSEDAVNSNSAPPPPISVPAGPYAAPYGYSSSYPFYPYYMPSYPMPPYPYAPAMGPPGGPLKDHFRPGLPPSPYPPYPYPPPSNHPQPAPPGSHLSPPPLHPPHGQPYGYAPSGLPYPPPRYPPPPSWGQSPHQGPYGGYAPPPPPPPALNSNGPTPYPYYPPSFPPPASQFSTFPAPTFNHYQPKPELTPRTASKKRRTSKALNSGQVAQPDVANSNSAFPTTGISAGPPVPVTFSHEVNQGVVFSVGHEDNVRDETIQAHDANEKTRECTTCKRVLAQASIGTICDKCRLRFKKHQMKAKQKYKLEPRKFLRDVKALVAATPESG